MKLSLLGTSKVSTDNKVTIIKEAAAKLSLNQKDMVAFYENENGDIIIKKVILKP